MIVCFERGHVADRIRHAAGLALDMILIEAEAFFDHQAVQLMAEIGIGRQFAGGGVGNDPPRAAVAVVLKGRLKTGAEFGIPEFRRDVARGQRKSIELHIEVAQLLLFRPFLLLAVVEMRPGIDLQPGGAGEDGVLGGDQMVVHLMIGFFHLPLEMFFLLFALRLVLLHHPKLIEGIVVVQIGDQPFA